MAERHEGGFFLGIDSSLASGRGLLKYRLRNDILLFIVLVLVKLHSICSLSSSHAVVAYEHLHQRVSGTLTLFSRMFQYFIGSFISSTAPVNRNQLTRVT